MMDTSLIDGTRARFDRITQLSEWIVDRQQLADDVAADPRDRMRAVVDRDELIRARAELLPEPTTGELCLADEDHRDGLELSEAPSTDALSAVLEHLLVRLAYEVLTDDARAALQARAARLRDQINVTN